VISEPGLGNAPATEVLPRGNVHERWSTSQLLLLPAEGDAVELNGPAALVWEALHSENRVDDIVRLVAEVYRESEAVVAPLVHGTIDQLRHHGLVITNA